jgi:hypothetical protein
MCRIAGNLFFKRISFLLHFKDDSTKNMFFSLCYLLPDLMIFSYINFTFQQSSNCFLSNGINHSVRRRVCEWMISAGVVPNMKHGGGVMVWGCLAIDNVSDLFRIQGTLNQHGYHSIL